MSLLSPENPQEVRESSWFFVPLFLVPMLAIPALWWRLYVTFEAAMMTLPLAIAAGLLLGVWVVRRTRRLIRLGLHPFYRGGRGLLRRNVAALFIFALLLAWGWALLLLCAGVVFATPTQDRTFRVAAVKSCRGKCSACPLRVEFADWPGASGSLFCVDHLAPRPQVGERLLVRGKFGELVQYVEVLRRP